MALLPLLTLSRLGKWSGSHCKRTFSEIDDVLLFGVESSQGEGIVVIETLSDYLDDFCQIIMFNLLQNNILH